MLEYAQLGLKVVKRILNMTETCQKVIRGQIALLSLSVTLTTTGELVIYLISKHDKNIEYLTIVIRLFFSYTFSPATCFRFCQLLFRETVAALLKL